MMTDRSTLILMSTGGCSLCEAALDLLLSMPELAGCRLRVADVATDDVWFERYGPRIPVLVCEGQELGWPFTREAVRVWVSAVTDA